VRRRESAWSTTRPEVTTRPRGLVTRGPYTIRTTTRRTRTEAFTAEALPDGTISCKQGRHAFTGAGARSHQPRRRKDKLRGSRESDLRPPQFKVATLVAMPDPCSARGLRVRRSQARRDADSTILIASNQKIATFKLPFEVVADCRSPRRQDPEAATARDDH
jgi:hypothetical protein